MSQTIYDKIWNEHLVHEQEDGTSLLFVDRHLIHEVTSPQAFAGLKRRNFSIEQINQIQNIYRIIYMEGRNNSQAIEKIESDIKDSIEKKIVLNFIKNSERGIIKGILD